VSDEQAWYETGTAPPEASFPWPPAEGDSVIGAFGRTWKGSSLQPRAFFGTMPAHGSLGAALLYYLPIGIAVAGANLFWTLARGTADVDRDAVLGRAETMTGLSPLTEFFFSPVMLLLSLFVSAAITHLLLRLFGGAHRDVWFTTRVFAFSYSPQLLGIVPMVGSVVGFVWMVVVAIIGLREGHGTSTGRAAAAVLIPVGIGLVFVALAVFLQLTGSLLEPGH
jgi:hypothetical protein